MKSNAVAHELLVTTCGLILKTLEKQIKKVIIWVYERTIHSDQTQQAVIFIDECMQN